MKQRVEEMEREANKLRELQAAAEQANNADSSEDTGMPIVTDEDKAASDSRSIYVGNVSIIFWTRILLPLINGPFFHVDRLTTVPLQKRFRYTFKLAARSTELQFFATNSLVTQKGLHPIISRTLRTDLYFAVVSHTLNSRNQSI